MQNPIGAKISARNIIPKNRKSTSNLIAAKIFVIELLLFGKWREGYTVES